MNNDLMVLRIGLNVNLIYPFLLRLHILKKNSNLFFCDKFP